VRLVFIVGTGRCGSTLVQEVLSRHPDVGFVSNLDNRLRALNLRGRWNNGLYRALPPTLSGFTTAARLPGWGGGASAGRRRMPKVERIVAPSEAYELLERRVSPSVRALAGDLGAEAARGATGRAFQAFFEERARAQRKPVFLHHFTGWPRAGFIRAVFPSVLFIHVVRDGRAVANSMAKAAWWHGREDRSRWGFTLSEPDEREWEASGRSLVVLGALQWKILMDAFDAARAETAAEQWVDCRFEAFVGEPREQTARLLDFMGLGWTEGFERQFARCSFRSERTGSYRREADQREVETVTRVVGDHLARLGYPVGPLASGG
jgi:hypothetical protein